MYQFIHYEKYTFAEIAGILGEAGREPGYIPHVQNPLEPETLLGDITELRTMLEREVPLTEYDVTIKSHGKDVACKRKIRSDANVLLAGVASYPVKYGDPDFELEDFKGWTDNVRKFLKKRFGKRLHTVVLHKDEAFLHLHFYVVPENFEMNTVCPADKAMKEMDFVCKDKPELSKVQVKALKKQAGKKALRDFQDDYYETVGIFSGQARFGPKRQRMSRKDWVTEVATNKLVAKCVSKTHNESLDTKFKAKKLTERVNELELKITSQNTIIEEQELMIGSWTGLDKTPSPTLPDTPPTPNLNNTVAGEFKL